MVIYQHICNNYRLASADTLSFIITLTD